MKTPKDIVIAAFSEGQLVTLKVIQKVAIEFKNDGKSFKAFINYLKESEKLHKDKMREREINHD